MTTATKTPGKPKRKPAARTAKAAAAKKTTAKKATKKTTARKATKPAAKKTPAKRKPAAKKTAAKPAAKKPAAPAKLAKAPKPLSGLAIATAAASGHRLAKVKAWESNRPGRLRADQCGVPKKFATALGVKSGESITLGLEAFAGYVFERNANAKVADRLDDSQIGELFGTMFPHRKGYHGSAGKPWSPELVQEFRARYNRGDFTNRVKAVDAGLPFSQRWTGDGWVTVRRGRKLGSKSTMKPKDDGVPKTKGFGNRKAAKATGAKASPKPAAKKATRKAPAKRKPAKRKPAAKKTVRKATVKKATKKTARKPAAKRTVKANRKGAARKLSSTIGSLKG